MAEIQLSVGSTAAIPKVALEKLYANLDRMGYHIIGPQIQDSAIVYKPLKNTRDLPKGYSSQQECATYRLVFTGHARYFDVTPGAQSCKQFFFPSQTELAAYSRDENGHWQVDEKMT